MQGVLTVLESMYMYELRLVSVENIVSFETFLCYRLAE